MEDRKISPEESLQIIEQMLADARNRFYNNGFAFLSWGLLVIVDCIVEYILAVCGKHNYISFVWLGTISVGMIATFVYYAAFAPKRRKYSKLDVINARLWLGFGISYFVGLYLFKHYQIPFPPFVYLLLGLAMFATGAIYKYKPVYFGAIVFWLGAIGYAFIDNGLGCLIESAAVMFLGYLTPGYLLWKKAKKEACV